MCVLMSSPQEYSFVSPAGIFFGFSASFDKTYAPKTAASIIMTNAAGGDSSSSFDIVIP